MSEPVRVLVAVAPLLLGDLIRLSLTQEPGYHVTLVREDDLPTAVGTFDVVVATTPVPPSVRSELVIVLPGPEAVGAPTTVIDLTGESWVAIPDVEAMIDLISLRAG